MINYLISISDKKYADFSKSLSNSDYTVIGVKIPVLRDIIKQNKDNSELDPNDFELGKYLEIDFIYFGLSLIRLKTSKEQLEFLKKNIGKAKSWAITDTISSYVKKLSFEEFFAFFKDCYLSKETYKRRIAYILTLKQYKDNDILKVLPLIQLNEEYMVMTAEAWLLSVIAIAREDEVFNYLKDCQDISLKRKTISKICDSFRFSKESKDRFKSLR